MDQGDRFESGICPLTFFETVLSNKSQGTNGRQAHLSGSS